MQLPSTRLDPADFVGELDGRRTGIFRIANGTGLSVAISNAGARLVQIQAPDRHGRPDDVVLGSRSLAGILEDPPSLGAFVAPYAGRIGGAAFTLGGRSYRLAANDGRHCLHGGPRGTCHRVFEVVHHGPDEIALSIRLPAQETGFPGSLDLSLNYRLDETDSLVITHEARCDGLPTPASFTSHAYFNLNLSGGTIDDHRLLVPAVESLALTRRGVAAGERLAVGDTLTDLRQPRRLGDLGPVDAAFVCKPEPDTEEHLCARLSCEATGRVLETWSTEPVLVVYTGDGLGPPHGPRMGICLEPQQYPNAPNCPAFPLNLVTPTRPYRATTRYRFLVS